MKRRWFKIIFFCLFLLVFFLSFRLSGSPSLPEVKEKIKAYPLKPGQVILIGIIPPEKTESSLPSLPEEILIEWQEKRLPSPEEKEKLRARLEELGKERQVLTCDFYGINQFGHRYAMIFDRLGYIRYRIVKVNEEIAQIKEKFKN